MPDGATEFKCCPPIRGTDNQDRLWRGLAEGVLDMVVSDHSPCTVDLKQQGDGDFAQAWGGIAVAPGGAARRLDRGPRARRSAWSTSSG